MAPDTLNAPRFGTAMTGLSNQFETSQKGLARLWRKFFRAANRMLVEKSFAGMVTVLVLVTVVVFAWP